MQQEAQAERVLERARRNADPLPVQQQQHEEEEEQEEERAEAQGKAVRTPAAEALVSSDYGSITMSPVKAC